MLGLLSRRMLFLFSFPVRRWALPLLTRMISQRLAALGTSIIRLSSLDA